MSVSIPSDYLNQIRRQAERDYPNETCGILVGPSAKKEKVDGIHPCCNVQDAYHALDPATFPRTARTAYFIDPKDLFQIQRENRKKEREIRVIYHSHVDAGAYFSEEDQRIALSDGKPAYPGVSYLVVSVRDGKAAEESLFSWDEKESKFISEYPKV